VSPSIVGELVSESSLQHTMLYSQERLRDIVKEVFQGVVVVVKSRRHFLLHPEREVVWQLSADLCHPSDKERIELTRMDPLLVEKMTTSMGQSIH